MLEAVEKSDQEIKRILGVQEFVPYHVAMPEIGQFVKEVKKQEAIKED